RALLDATTEPSSRVGVRRWLVLAAALVLVVAGTAVLIDGGDGPEQRLTTTPPQPTVSLTDLGPGWHPLDTGPVPAMSTVELAWTGAELVVVGATTAGAESYAYDPSDGEWTEIPGFPLDAGMGVGLVWTGEVLLAV